MQIASGQTLLTSCVGPSASKLKFKGVRFGSEVLDLEHCSSRGQAREGIPWNGNLEGDLEQLLGSSADMHAQDADEIDVGTNLSRLHARKATPWHSRKHTLTIDTKLAVRFSADACKLDNADGSRSLRREVRKSTPWHSSLCAVDSEIKQAVHFSKDAIELDDADSAKASRQEVRKCTPWHSSTCDTKSDSKKPVQRCAATEGIDVNHDDEMRKKSSARQPVHKGTPWHTAVEGIIKEEERNIESDAESWAAEAGDGCASRKNLAEVAAQNKSTAFKTEDEEEEESQRGGRLRAVGSGTGQEMHLSNSMQLLGASSFLETASECDDLASAKPLELVDESAPRILDDAVEEMEETLYLLNDTDSAQEEDEEEEEDGEEEQEAEQWEYKEAAEFDVEEDDDTDGDDEVGGQSEDEPTHFFGELGALLHALRDDARTQVTCTGCWLVPTCCLAHPDMSTSEMQFSPREL